MKKFIPFLVCLIFGTQGAFAIDRTVSLGVPMSALVNDASGNSITSHLIAADRGLDVNCIAGCTSSGGASYTLIDKAAFTYGTSLVVPGAGIYQDTSPTLTAGQTGAFRLTANRAQHVNLRDSSGNEITSWPVTGTFWPVTQPVSGTFWQATQPVSGTFWQATQPVSGTVTANVGTTNGLALDATLTGGSQQSKITDGTNVATVKAASTAAAAADKALVVAVSPNNTVGVTGTFFQATQPVSGSFFQATQPVSIASMPTTPVTGTFFQGTQPVSIASMPSTAVTNAGTFAVQAALNAETTKVIGTVNVAAAQTIAVTQATGTNLHAVIDTGSTTAVTQATAANLNATVVQATPASLQTTVTPIAITKATQGATGFTTQDLKDAGRSARTITLDGFAIAATTETLNTMSYSTDNGTLTTGTSYTVTAAKRLRIQSITASLHTIAGNTTPATVIVRIRVNNVGAAIVSSPVQMVFAIPGITAANNSTAPISISIPDGWEFVAAAGIGVTTTCPGFVTTTAAPKVDIAVVGYEY